ncbi:MAG: hypothetical protein QOI81_393 [Actinomycetota bacterium]|nr:hypothetical protein [Actinomycetota bacterium]
MDRERLQHEEEEGWQALLRTFARVPSNRFDEPTLTPEGWSAKDAMFHVGYWLADCVRVLDTIAAGTFERAAEDAIDIEELNAQGFARSRGMETDAVRAGFLGARSRSLESFGRLESLTPDAWEWFEESGPLHYRKHVEDLDLWLQQ